MASKYWPVWPLNCGADATTATCRAAFSGERRRCTRRSSGQTSRNDGIVCDVIDWVIWVQAMPGCTRLTVTCSAGSRRARARLANTFSSLAWA